MVIKRSAQAVLFSFAGAIAPYCAGADALREACDGEAWQIVLNAADSKTDAAAIWLDRRLARWPGNDGSASFKLYFAPDGAMLAKPGAKVSGAAGALTLEPARDPLAPAVATRFKYVGPGATVRVRDADLARLPELHQQQLILVQENDDGTVRAATRLQAAGALDDLFGDAAKVSDLGVKVDKKQTSFKLWAPTARQVALCTYHIGSGPSSAVLPMQRAANGVWSAAKPADLSGGYYKYVVDVLVPGVGLVRNLVTDPYSISLTTDSRRSYIANLDAARLKPEEWDSTPAPKTVKALPDMTVYELHIRDFTINDHSVSPPRRGKYAAFKEVGANGMEHLYALARAGITDIHLLPAFDFGSVPEAQCDFPLASGSGDSEAPQALLKRTAETDCYNWGYDPYHYSAPEGSYATDPADGAVRIVEFRMMVTQLHRAGLRVGMDVVYNHTYTGGQKEKSVLDRIVPGYYHRLNAAGAIERSTCCDNTATENLMMAKLMSDSVAHWARHYKIDSFRFDLMGHQPRAAMEQVQAQVDAAAGRHVQLIGEGWNFGEVADGARFVQASQLSLGGSGIGTFSDRARDAVRGGSAGDEGDKMVKQQGFINGLVYDPNALAGPRPKADLMQASDMVKVGLAGSLRTYALTTWKDQTVELQAIDYGGQPAGYASAPGEAVNYVENHDNHTLFDINVLKLPLATSTDDRARVQMLGAAINAFSQGVAYFHAGIDTLRSKSLDRNSFNSGDWFNRIDWTYRTNYFGTGAPPAEDNGKDYDLIKPFLADPSIKPGRGDIIFARDAFRDLLKIRASSTLFRLRTTDDVKSRLHFHNTGSNQEPTVIFAHLDGAGYAGANFKGIAYLINVDKVAHTVAADAEKGKQYRLHPVHSAAGAADKRAAQARYDSAAGSFTVPPRTAVVFVE